MSRKSDNKPNPEAGFTWPWINGDTFYTGKTKRSSVRSFSPGDRVRFFGYQGTFRAFSCGIGADRHIIWAHVTLDNGRETGVPASGVKPA